MWIDTDWMCLSGLHVSLAGSPLLVQEPSKGN